MRPDLLQRIKDAYRALLGDMALDDFDKRFEAYINGMTNLELLQAISYHVQEP